jgi:hypothetical protein
MEADMADQNGNDLGARANLDAVQAQLGERVANPRLRQTDLETEMRTRFRTIEQSTASLTTSLSARNKPQWQAIGVALTFAIIIGGMAYWTIRESTTDLKPTIAKLAAETYQSIRMLADKAVTRQQMDWRAARGGKIASGARWPCRHLGSKATLCDLRVGRCYRSEFGRGRLPPATAILNPCRLAPLASQGTFAPLALFGPPAGLLLLDRPTLQRIKPKQSTSSLICPPA